MNVLIVGAGTLGFELARRLSSERYDVTIIEKSSRVIEKFAEYAFLNIIHGDASSIDVLEKAEAKNVGCVIATTKNDATNMMVSKLAECVFKVPITISSIHDPNLLKPEYIDLFSKDNFAIDFPVDVSSISANFLCNISKVNGAFDITELRGVVLIKTICKEKSVIVNTPISHINGFVFGDNIKIICIERENDTIINPGGSEVLLAGDKVYFCVEEAKIESTMKAFGYDNFEGDQTGECLSIVIDKKTPTELVNRIKKIHECVNVVDIANLIQDDSFEEYSLFSSNFKLSDTILILTRKEESMVLAGLLLKKNFNKRIILPHSLSKYSSLLREEAGFVTVDLNSVICEAILNCLQNDDVKIIRKLKNDLGYIIEISVTEKYPWIGSQIKNLPSKNDIIPISLEHDGEIKIVDKNDVIPANSRMTLFVTKDGLKKIKHY